MELSVQDKVSAAKIQLMLKHPFIGSLLFGFPIQESERLPTAWTDGRRIWYNPKFFEELSVKNVIFCLAHECMHMAFLHVADIRKNQKDPDRWNAAGDIVINKILKEDDIGEFIEGCLYDERMYYKGNETTEGVYNELGKNKDNRKGHDYLMSPGNGDNNKKGDNTSSIPEVYQSDEALAADMKIRIAQAAQAAKAAGKLSSGLKRFVDSIIEPKVDWRTVLYNFMVRCKDDTRSWSRPNRRFVCQRLYVPSVSGECMDDIVVAVDCSGSIDNEVLSQFAGEIMSISDTLSPKNVHVIYFDSEVSHYDVFPRGETPEIAPHGGGGTAFSPVFDYIYSNDINPVCCVFLTDLYCDDFGSEPEFPVLWVSTGDEKAPFGGVVKISV